MKVLYLYDNFPAYRKDFFALLDSKLHEKKMQFAFYYGSQKENASLQETVSSFPIKSFPIVESRVLGIELKRYKDFRKAFKKYNPDVVVLQFHVAILTYWWAYFYMKRHHIPFIIWDCNYTRDTLGSVMVSIRKKFVDFTFKKAAACITYGSVFRDYLKDLGRKEEDIFIAQNTINIESIISHRSKNCSNRRFEHPIHFLYVGALLDRKYVDSAVIAVANLINKGYDIYFDIVGDGPEKSKIIAIIQERKAEKHIIMHGAKYGDELKEFFEKDDVFLLPGTGGLAINEALAYSMPIISTIGDDTVVDLMDGNGILLNSFGDVDEIETALNTFLDLPESEKQTMSHRSEQVVKERASLENMANQHVRAIEHVRKEG